MKADMRKCTHVYLILNWINLQLIFKNLPTMGWKEGKLGKARWGVSKLDERSFSMTFLPSDNVSSWPLWTQYNAQCPWPNWPVLVQVARKRQALICHQSRCTLHSSIFELTFYNIKHTSVSRQRINKCNGISKCMGKCKGTVFLFFKCKGNARGHRAM